MIDLERLTQSIDAASPAPRYIRVREALTTQIADGTLRAGEALPSERSLKEGLKVSRATIREALRGLIEAGLIQAVPGSGNFVLEHLVSPQPQLVQSEHNVVGLIVSYPSFHIYYGQLAAVFNQHLREAGWFTDLALHNDRLESMQEIIDNMMRHNVRVFAINPLPYTDMVPILDRLLAQGALVQLLGRWINDPRCDYVGADNELLGYEGTCHLIELGHTHIIYHGGTVHPTGRDRAYGYVRAMKEAGLAPRLFNVYYRQDNTILPDFLPYYDPENTPEVLFNEMVQGKISAVFSFNDDGAAWLHNQMRKFNLVTPRDVSLVSVDNLPYHSFLEAPLTTFALPGEEVGKRAAELLLRRISGETFPPQRVLIPARFIQRLSTAPPFTQERVSKLLAN